jgi:hypothetical protein
MMDTTDCLTGNFSSGVTGLVLQPRVDCLTCGAEYLVIGQKYFKYLIKTPLLLLVVLQSLNNQ